MCTNGAKLDKNIECTKFKTKKVMAKRKIFIQVPRGTVDKLCKAFRCKKTAVYDALNFETDSELANIIRKNAIESYGGVKTSKLILK